VVEIKLNKEGYLDLNDLKEKLNDKRYKDRVKIGSFSAASNVTGIKTDVYEVGKILHENNALACFDYAASAPYVEIDMNKSDKEYIDAVFFSPHKFIGGPGSPGVLVVNGRLYNRDLAPTVAGGGTVDYVSEFGHDFYKNPEDREKAGTPAIIQAIKASLAIELKREIGTEKIEKIEEKYTKIFMDKLKNNKNVEILGPLDPEKRISIISFRIKHNDKHLHPRLATRLLNDLFGIQSRAGCACAGPYGHRLLGIGQEDSIKYRNIVQKEIHSLKPGWTRINLHYTMTEVEVDYIIKAVEFIGEYGYLFLDEYEIDLLSGKWTHIEYDTDIEAVENFGVKRSFKYIDEDFELEPNVDRESEYDKYLKAAYEMAENLEEKFSEDYKEYKDDFYEQIRWFEFINYKNLI
jgi:selenocysteine lyase/cysteine desulfurase